MSDKEPQGIHKEVPNLPDGETVYFKDDVLSPGHDSRYDAPYATADTFIIGKKSLIFLMERQCTLKTMF